MKKSTSSILVLCILLSVILSSFSSAETTEPSIMTKASDQVSMTFDEYLEQGGEDWFLTGKRQYAVQAMMVSQETSFHNELEVVDYTVTDDGVTVILKGSFDEMWATKLSKVISTYTKPDGSEIHEADFAEKDVWIDIVTIPSPDAYYAMYVPLNVSVTVETAWGDVLHTNLPNAPHGEGDYLVCWAGENGAPDLSDVWVLNGVVFPEYYDSNSGNEPVYAEKLFDNSFVHRIDIRLADADWSGLLSDPISKTKYAADIVIDGETFSNVTFSTKGFSSLYFVAYGEEESRRYSFKVNFGKLVEGQTYYGLDKLSLNGLFCDNTWMKDLISYRMFRDAGVEAPLVSYVWLTVNGTDQGLYMAVEDVNEGFLNRAYQGEGVIYSVERTIDTSNITRESMGWIRENGFPPAANVHGADLLYTGEDPANYADILDNVETKAHPSDPGRVISAIRALSLEESINDFFDMDEIIRFFAAHNVLLDFDSYTGSQLSNLKLHEQDGRLSLIPWDYNLAFGTFPSVIGFEHWEDPTWLMNLGMDTPLMGAEEDGRPLWKVIRSHPEYLAAYHEALRALLSSHLLTGAYEAEIDRVSAMLLPWIEKDPTAFCTAGEFQAACGTMKMFLAIRTESIRKQLAGELSTVSGEQKTQAMVDASGLDLRSLGALVVGE